MHILHHADITGSRSSEAHRKEVARAYVAAGRKAQLQGDNEHALELFQKAVQYYPENPSLLELYVLTSSPSFFQV